MKRVVFLSFLLAFVAGCGNKSTQDGLSNTKTKVLVAKVILAPTSQELQYSGTVEALQTIPLTFQTSGTVEKVFVDAGDVVRKGQLLATVDPSDLQNIYATTLAKFNQAQDAYDRLKQVHDQGSLPDIKWVEMKSNLEQAKAALDLAKNNLEKCRMVAPTDGLVGRRNIEPGQASITLSGAPIELVKIEKVNVKISVPENEINRISKGRKATITVVALDGKQFQGEVSNISPVAEVMSRTYTVKILIDNPGKELKPGMVCDVNLSELTGSSALVVPYRAVGKDSNGNNFVFVVSSDQKSVKKQPVTVGKFNNNGIEIVSGLTEGTLVVSGGVEKLSDNALIEL